jgi:hypothetical protein
MTERYTEEPYLQPDSDAPEPGEVDRRDWDIPPRIWAILASWGLAVLGIAGLLSFWIWHNEQEQEAREARLQLEQDSAMCAIVEAVVGGPEPVAGPEGDRARHFRELMVQYRAALHCQELDSLPGPARDRD